MYHFRHALIFFRKGVRSVDKKGKGNMFSKARGILYQIVECISIA